MKKEWMQRGECIGSLHLKKSVLEEMQEFLN